MADEEDNKASDDDVISLEGFDAVDEPASAAEEEPPAESEDKAEGEDEKSEEASAEEDGNSAFDHYQTDSDQFDDFLADEDPGFAASLKDLKSIENPKSEEGEEEEDDSIELDEGLLKVEKASFLSTIAGKLGRLLTPYYWFKSKIDNLIFRARRGMKNAKAGIKYALGDGREVVMAKIKENIAKVFGPIGQFFVILKKMSWKGRSFLVASLALAYFLVTSIGTLITGKFLPHPGHQWVDNFETVADEAFAIDMGKGLEPFDSSLRHPEYVILLKKIVANLRRPPGSIKNPMGLFEFYIEATNQEAAVEMKDRESEFRDRIQRTIEGMTYRELRAPEGKAKLKSFVRKDVNEVINKGRVKKVFIKTMTLKP